MDTEKKFPFYLRATVILIGFYFLITILSRGKSIFVPLIFSMLIAIMLNSVVNILVNRRWNRILAIAVTVFLFLGVIGGLVTVIFSQSVRLGENLPVLFEKLLVMVNNLSTWMSGYFHISPTEVNTYIVDAKNELLSKSSVMIGNTITAAGSMLIVIFLVPAYIFMILYYKPLLIDFTLKLMGSKNNEQVGEVLYKTRTIIKSYLTGLMIELGIVFLMNTTGLLILGMDYALVLGLVGAILNLIPYLGSLIAACLYMVVALLTKDSSSYIVYVGVLYLVVQLIDNNYLVPKIVGSKVKINALVSIVAVISGGALWGIPGMFLAIPLTAIIKLIFDSIDGMEPWAYLLGDTMPSFSRLNMDFIRKRLKKKESQTKS